MREIKFRAWYEKEKEMQNVRDIYFNKETGEIESFITRGKKSTYATDVHTHKLMQYTGLKDKNGVEIYFDDALTNGEMTRLVIWREDDSQIQLSVNDDNHDNRIKLTQHLIDEFGLIVCGNIYENPELLEVQNG